MRLYYYEDPSGLKNFGDDLNPWLWSRLLPNTFDDNHNSIFVGIGTLLNKRIPNVDNVVIFGSGVGYGPVPIVTDSWRIYCVRGPLSAKKLNIDSNYAITDSAMLISKVVNGDELKSKHNFSYMPHALSSYEGENVIKSICHEANVTYIDARWPIEEVVASIRSSSVLLTEAMHGAIVSEALGIPWVPIVSRDFIFPFKWHDWCASMEIEYKPSLMPSVFDKENCNTIARNLTNKINIMRAKFRLKHIVDCCKPVSANKVLKENKIDMLLTKLELFKNDFAYEIITPATKLSNHAA